MFASQRGPSARSGHKHTPSAHTPRPQLRRVGCVSARPAPRVVALDAPAGTIKTRRIDAVINRKTDIHARRVRCKHEAHVSFLEKRNDAFVRCQITHTHRHTSTSTGASTALTLLHVSSVTYAHDKQSRDSSWTCNTPPRQWADECVCVSWSHRQCIAGRQRQQTRRHDYAFVGYRPRPRTRHVWRVQRARENVCNLHTRRRRRRR